MMWWKDRAMNLSLQIYEFTIKYEPLWARKYSIIFSVFSILFMYFFHDPSANCNELRDNAGNTNDGDAR